jgi:hypothetical protein
MSSTWIGQKMYRTGSGKAYLGHGLNHVGVPRLHGLEHLAELQKGGLVRHAGLEGANVSEALSVPVLAIIKKHF